VQASKEQREVAKMSTSSWLIFYIPGGDAMACTVVPNLLSFSPPPKHCHWVIGRQRQPTCDLLPRVRGCQYLHNQGNAETLFAK